MLERLAGIVVLAGLIISLAGSVAENENLKMTGILILLVTATVAGYRFLKFHATNPTSEFVGPCIEQKRSLTYYALTFRAGGTEIYSGRASLQTGAKIKVGEKARVKIKGPVILEINKV